MANKDVWKITLRAAFPVDPTDITSISEAGGAVKALTEKAEELGLVLLDGPAGRLDRIDIPDKAAPADE